MIITVPSIFLWVSLCLVQCFAQTPVAVDSIASHNATRNKKKKTPVDINSITVDSFQCSKRKLILEIGKGGLGNKLWGVLSGTMMALSMGRTLEVDWPDEVKQLKGVFEDFFVSPIVPRGEAFNLTKRYSASEHKEVIYPHTRCNVDLTVGSQKHGLAHLGDTNWVIRSPTLLGRLDAECDTIRMKLNFDLSGLLLDPGHGEFSSKLKEKFPLSNHDVFKKGFLVPRPEHQIRVDLFKRANGLGSSGSKYATFHSRGLFDADGQLTRVGLECAKSLVDKKLVNKIFFSSDQRRMLNMAKSILPAANFVAYENKTMVLSLREMAALGMLANLTAPPKDPSYAIRNESDIAFFEWLLIGSGDYCITPTVSTFAMTSILRSECTYLDAMKGADCSDGVTAPIPRTTEPPLFQRYIQLDRYFAVNSTCNVACETVAWNSIKRVFIPATNTSSADRKRELCATIGDTSTLVKAYYQKQW